jgi:hypothetical protein
VNRLPFSRACRDTIVRARQAVDEGQATLLEFMTSAETEFPRRNGAAT